MADSEKKVSYELDANPSGFEAGLQRGADALRGFSGQAESNFKKVQDSLGTVMKQLTILAGIVAGGAFFKDAIGASNQLTGETMKLSKAMGMNAEEAGTLRTALEDIGSSSDDYVETFTKFARQVKSNEDGLRAYGIQTRDANGHLRDSKTLFTEALQSVGQYKAGIDQNTYAQTVFGKSIDNVMQLQKLNNAVLEEAKRKNEELGLIVTKDNVEASKAYKLAMNDVSDVLTAVKKVIGDAVMPVFTELGQYLASTGPYVVGVFKGAMLVLLTVFEVVKGAVKAVSGVLFETISQAIDLGGLLGEMFVHLVKAEYGEVLEVGVKIGQRIKQGVRNVVTNMSDVASETGDAIARDFNRLYGPKVAADAPKGGTKRMGEFRDTKDTSRVSQWDAELAESKLAFQEQRNLEGSFQQFSKQQELAFWKDKLAITASGTAENVAVRRKVAELQLSIGADAFAREQAGLVAQEAAYKSNLSARLGLLDQEAALVKQRFGQESKEYEEVQKKIIETKRQAVEQQKQIDMQRAESARNSQLSELELALSQATLERDLHMMSTSELIGLQQQFEDRRFQIVSQGIKERLEIAQADPDRNPVELNRLHLELEEAEREHQRRLGEVRNQATRESQRFTLQAYGSIQSGWAQTIGKFAQGQMTIVGFFRSMWQNVVQGTIQALAQMGAEWLAKTLLARLLGKTTALSEISANAGVAGAAAFASTAAIPIIGPELAPAAAAAAFSGAMSYAGALASAEGGFDIPAAVNPLVQTHAKEMILPAQYADVIRGLADQGSQGQQAQAPVDVKVHKMPGNFFMIHRDELVKALGGAKRDFAFK